LSDAHVLDRRPASRRATYELGVRFVSLGRPLDADRRARNVLRALRAAEKAGADHFVISGDLTETGTPEQFDAFASILADTKIDPLRITLVPGNHDAYTSPTAWQEAMHGPLAPYARTSASAPGHVVDLGDVFLLPVDVACHQPVTRSAGELSRDAAFDLERRFKDPLLAKAPVVVVQHHPPYRRFGMWQWIDGLRGWAGQMGLLERFPHVHLLHGHLHRAVSRIVSVGRDRIFGASAVVDDEDAPRVRLYEVQDGLLVSTGLAGS
jgi:3',5'-cyclic AMP phosphodiesterase CpdA